MKNVFKLLVVVVLLLANVEVKAADGFDVKVSNDQILTVELAEGEKGAILFFQDKKGEILFKDNLLFDDNYKKNFNLEVIPNGVYFLILEKENSIQTTEVTKTVSGLELTGKTSKTIFKPQFKVEKNLVKVFLTNPGMKEASFQVYDKKGVLVNTITYDDLVVNKTFDFSKVPAGKYTITVQVEGRTFTKEFNVG